MPIGSGRSWSNSERELEPFCLEGPRAPALRKRNCASGLKDTSKPKHQILPPPHSSSNLPLRHTTLPKMYKDPTYDRCESEALAVTLAGDKTKLVSKALYGPARWPLGRPRDERSKLLAGAVAAYSLVLSRRRSECTGGPSNLGSSTTASPSSRG